MPSKIDRVLFIADLHGGQTFAPTLRGQAVSKRQEFISDVLVQVIERAKREARGHKLGANYGGDLVHNPYSDKSRELVAQLLLPIANMADEQLGAYGTEYHVGSNDEGSDDRAIYRELGVKSHKPWHYRDYDGLILDWAHHGVGVSKSPILELNGLRSKVDYTYWRALQYGDKPPAVIVRHHAHYCPPHSPIYWRGMWAAIGPAMCLPDGFAGKVAAGMPPTVGALWWDVTENNLTAWLYPVPREYWYE